MVLPDSASVFMTATTSPTSSGSSAEVGSSNRSRSGFVASARAIPTLCFCPPDRRLGKASLLSSRPTRSSRISASATTSSRGLPCTCTGAAVRFCSTVMWGHRLKCWNTMPMRERTCASSRGDIRLAPPSRKPTRLPDRNTAPASGRSSQLTQRRRVDLPDPLGPSRHTVWPLRMVRVMPSRIRLVPKLLVTPVTCSTTGLAS